MPAWRCPHCGAPQPESSRCWVCQRSTTCCATCRHFRRGVASGLGYCGLDRRRRPLHGDEMRACWSGGLGPVLSEPLTPPPVAARPVLAFVPVELVISTGPRSAPPDDGPTAARDPEPPVSRGWTLWGDAFL